MNTISGPPAGTSTDPAQTHRRTSPRATAVVDALVGAGLLDPVRRGAAADVVSDVLDGKAQEPGGRRWFAEVAGYVGGALVVAAVVLFLLETWDSFGTAARVGVLAGVAVVLAAVALAIRQPRDDVRRRLAATLFVGAAVTAAAAVGVLAEELDGDEYSGLPGVLFAVTLALVGLAGYRLAPSVLGQLAVVVGLIYAPGILLEDVLDLDGPTPLVLAGYLVLLGVGWLALAERRIWNERLAARIIGCGVVALAVQWPLFWGEPAWIAYVLTAAAAACAFAAYVQLRAWPYLVLGVALVTIVVPEALIDWTDGTLGVAGILLVSGLGLLGASLFGLRLRRGVQEG
ncbi:MAG: hypothetical protein Q8Q02_14240 [Nocardioides sp.]|nr:hypothetical protein [Nocardioides sp.]